MDAPPEPRRTFALADLLLLLLGLGLGFTLLSHFRAEAVRSDDFPDYSEGWLFNAGPFELLLTGLSLGLVFAFPILRIRDSLFDERRRRFSVTDACGALPALSFLFYALAALLGGGQTIVGFVFAFLFLVSMIIQVAFAMMSVLLGMVIAIDRRRHWLDLLGCLTGAACGAVMIRALMQTLAP
jgi:hypothetical protein